jgi:hypothetical protein
VVRGEYVVGWAKRGPKGLIGNNKPDSAATVEAMLADLPLLRRHGDGHRRSSRGRPASQGHNGPRDDGHHPRGPRRASRLDPDLAPTTGMDRTP